MTLIALSLISEKKMLFSILLEIHGLEVTKEIENTTVPLC